ncbi:NAD binding 4, Sterile and/or Epimerase domain containing protein [Asbolus verrucosus]|uniref:Fatty acyl-CoA reductase n=1 Tax=Asbolus verrucosus TaxID=1661398 RepID=A0A482WBQ7_ASBVE|nr:NAD binding 4, Sterile and/or Epimerase domain containing protein [Asbolus verrucosus]
MDNPPSIPEFFRDKSVFITGGSGFVGKVLVEKLLRSCPDLKSIYLLMRHKKGKTPRERICAITDLPLFDSVRASDPDALQKVKAVTGDVMELDLGLSAEDRRLLIDEVGIVVHCAASVRFDDPLHKAVIMNVRGTRELARLALEMKKVEVVVHISTTYCNTDREVIGEQLYPACADWKETIAVAENADKHSLNVLTSKYIHPQPNTYTFAKSLGEHVVNDMLAGRVPAVIFRPSIVISTALEPFPGWIDNFNGPVGLLVACGKGIVRTNHGNPEVILDYVPVDIVAKAIIISAWKQATFDNPKLVGVYNGSNNNLRNVTMGEMIELGRRICWEAPVNSVLWYPAGGITRCVYLHWFKLIFYQLLPALVLDGAIKLAGHKPILMRIQRRIYVATEAVRYFSNNQWQFKNERCLGLEDDLLPCDHGAFAYRKDEVDVYDFFKNATLGARKYLLNESDESLEGAKRHYRRMWAVAQVFNVVWYLALLWIVFVKVDVLSILDGKRRDFLVYLNED